MMIWLRYVPLAEVGTRLAQGWTITDDMSDCHHGRHAVLMVWEGDNEPA